MQHNFNDLEDFLRDESFRTWALTEGDKTASPWEQWLIDNPERRSKAESAAVLLRSLHQQEIAISETELSNAEARLKENIRMQNENTATRVRPMRRYWYAAAAAIVVLAIAGLLLKYYVADRTPYEKIATQYGQVKQEVLPDGSSIALNANTSLRYAKNWGEGADREVWVQGEAFFHVKKTEQRTKFIVHTDAFDIVVTGTSFSVINRGGKSSIALKEGSVQIRRPGQPDISMIPGDFVESADKQLLKKTLDKTDYLAWTENKLVFDNTPLATVAEKIREHYGIEVKLAGPNVSEKTITGIMPNDNLEVLLRSLEATQEYIIQQEKNTITITTKN